MIAPRMATFRDELLANRPSQSRMTTYVALLLLGGCPAPAPKPQDGAQTRAAPSIADLGCVESAESLAKAAEAAYTAKDFPRCAALWRSAAALSRRNRGDAFYNAACCLGREGMTEEALATLSEAVSAGFRDAAFAERDTDLAALHDDRMWRALLDAMERANARFENTVADAKLRRELLEMAAEDQSARQRQDWTAILEIDGRNLQRMKNIVERHGWPGRQLVGADGAQAAWILVQHADRDLAFQKRCRELLREVVRNGGARPTEFAYLDDRIAVAEHRKQLYGTQFVGGEPAPIEDEANVDVRRREVGLGPMSEYRERMREHR